MTEERSSIEFQQRRGVAWDIIEEALETYRQFMLDDDYEPYTTLANIMKRMQERSELYGYGANECGGHGEKAAGDEK